jgi:lysophospholipase L1-like esterase
MKYLRVLLALTLLILLSPVTQINSTVTRLTASTSQTVAYITGDSTVATAYLPNQQRDGFTTRLSNRICGQYCNTPNHETIINLAQGGQRLTGTASNTLTNLWPNILSGQYGPVPTTIIVEIGINDMGLTSDSTFTDAYKNLVYSALNLNIRVIPCLMVPVDPSWPSYNAIKDQRASINNWLKLFWGQDAVAHFDDATRLPNSLNEDYHYSWDGLHQNPWGIMNDADSIPLDRIV